MYIYINRTLSSPVEMANFLKLIPVKQISVWEKQLTPTFWPTINLLERGERKRELGSRILSRRGLRIPRSGSRDEIEVMAVQPFDHQMHGTMAVTRNPMRMLSRSTFFMGSCRRN